MANHHDPDGSENGAPDLIRISCRMADWLGFPEVKRQDVSAEAELPPRLRGNPELEPERLRGLITKQIATMSA